MNKVESLQAQWLEGVRLVKACDYEQAYYCFKAIIDQDPNCAPALAGMANVYYETYQRHKAWECAKKAVELLPRHSFTLGLALQCALSLGKFDVAKQYAKRAYKLAPKAADGIKSYLLYLKHTGETAKIERLARELLAVDKNVLTLLVAGGAFETIGRIPEAIRIYRRAITDVMAANPPPPTAITRGAGAHEKSKIALLTIKQHLDSLGVPFCLAHGTLLGIYRDGDLLFGDSDVDVMLPWSVEREWLAGELARLGCRIEASPQELRSAQGQWGFGVRLPPDESVVELTFLKPENGKVWFGFARGQYTIKLPLSPFKFTTMQYLGIPFPIPHPCDVHLREIYGEGWHTRTRNRNFFVINPNIVDEGNIRVAYTFAQILSGLTKGDYKKAQGYTEQLLSVYDDPLLYELREYFAKLPFDVALFPPLEWQPQRLHYRDVIG